MSKTCIVIHAKVHSSRVPDKNFRLLGDSSLLMIAVKKCAETTADVYVDSDGVWVEDLVKDYSKFILRPVEFADNSTDGNQLLLLAVDQLPEYDYILQISCCCPFLRKETIQRAIDILETEEADNLITVKAVKEYFWDSNGIALYDLVNLPNSYELDPLFMETHGIYGISKDLLLATRLRVSDDPYFLVLNELFEELDINTLEDFTKAEIIYDKI